MRVCVRVESVSVQRSVCRATPPPSHRVAAAILTVFVAGNEREKKTRRYIILYVVCAVRVLYGNRDGGGCIRRGYTVYAYRCTVVIL